MLKSSNDVDEDAAQSSNTSSRKLLLTHDDWMEKYKVQDGGRDNSSSCEKKFQKNRRGKGNGGGRNRGEGRDPNKPSSTPYFKCQKTSHWSCYCPNNKPKKKQAHLAQGEEDEPTLLMAHAVISVNPTSHSSPSSTCVAAPPPHRHPRASSLHPARP
jgi:hypothetical protein